MVLPGEPGAFIFLSSFFFSFVLIGTSMEGEDLEVFCFLLGGF
jgi:hypothetical protein